MITDGERLKRLLMGAQRKVLLCAPFIKSNILESLFSIIPTEATIQVVTRWRASEVAAGVSDLEVFDIVNNRPGARLALLNELHAKLYVADQKCLLGSANLTGAALGWSKNPNVELLIESDINNPEVAWLIYKVKNAEEATSLKRETIATEANKIETILLLGEEEAVDDLKMKTTWLPKCAAPNKLYLVYENRDAMSVIQEVKDNAVIDLQDLLIPKGLHRQEFNTYIRNSLKRIPIISDVLQMASFKINDDAGVQIIKQARKDLADHLAVRQWQILRDWLICFFEDELELAAESFVLRPKRQL
jgi:hypothetical protein